MNKVILIGRLTADPELKYTNNNVAFTRFTLAVNRDFTKDDGTRDADFISIVGWDKRADLICKYLKKGNRVGIEGRIQTGSYEKEDGSKGYLTDVIVGSLEFLENKSKDDRPAPEYTDEAPDEEEDPFADFGDTVEIADDDLPF